jgi:hypothetical protein
MARGPNALRYSRLVVLFVIRAYLHGRMSSPYRRSEDDARILEHRPPSRYNS